MPTSLCVSLEREPGSFPMAARLLLGSSSLVFASPPFLHQKLSDPVPWNLGKIMEAEWGLFPKNKKWGAQRGFCARKPHRALLSYSFLLSSHRAVMAVALLDLILLSTLPVFDAQRLCQDTEPDLCPSASWVALRALERQWFWWRPNPDLLESKRVSHSEYLQEWSQM